MRSKLWKIAFRTEKPGDGQQQPRRRDRKHNSLVCVNMSSGDSSELPGPIELSDSLDMTIGFKTEVGWDTIVDWSSSGGQGLSDPTI